MSFKTSKLRTNLFTYLQRQLLPVATVALDTPSSYCSFRYSQQLQSGIYNRSYSLQLLQLQILPVATVTYLQRQLLFVATVAVDTPSSYSHVSTTIATHCSYCSFRYSQQLQLRVYNDSLSLLQLQLLILPLSTVTYLQRQLLFVATVALDTPSSNSHLSATIATLFRYCSCGYSQQLQSRIYNDPIKKFRGTLSVAEQWALSGAR